MSGEGSSNQHPQDEQVSATGWGDLPVSTSSACGDSWGGGSGWDQTYALPRRWNTESPINWELEDEETGETEMEAEAAHTPELSNRTFAEQKTLEEYNRETSEYTKAAVDQLVHSPEYLRYTTRCQMCWCVWSEGQCSPTCNECGGFAMQRPCVVCKGKCGAIFTRNVELSHSDHRAMWDGDCRLPEEEKAGYMFLLLSQDMTEEDVLEGLGDLSTG